jgi:hypothetical protein
MSTMELLFAGSALILLSMRYSSEEKKERKKKLR